MAFALKIEEITYQLWLGENAPILLFEALGIPLDSVLTDAPNIEAAIAESLNPQKLFNKLKTFESRKAIASILLQEGEFTPELPYDELKLARRLEINSLLSLIGDVFTKYNSVNPTNEAAIAPQPDLIQESVINVLPMPTSNIVEGLAVTEAIA